MSGAGFACGEAWVAGEEEGREEEAGEAQGGGVEDD